MITRNGYQIRSACEKISYVKWEVNPKRQFIHKFATHTHPATIFRFSNEAIMCSILKLCTQCAKASPYQSLSHYSFMHILADLWSLCYVVWCACCLIWIIVELKMYVLPKEASEHGPFSENSTPYDKLLWTNLK